MTAQLKLSVLVLIIMFVVATLYTKRFIPNSSSVDSVSEPKAKQEKSPESSLEEPMGGSLEIVNPTVANLFPQNDWRRTSGNLWIIGEDEGFFIFKGEPSLSKDGMTLTFNACTLVAPPPKKEGTTDEERYRASFIFESNESVTLTLDRSLADFTRFKANDFGISSFKEGRVLGKIEVRSAMESPAPDDDFVLSAHDVVFNLQQLVANREVSLRYGRNSCAGTGLRVDLDVPSHLSVKRSRPDVAANQNAQEKEVDKLVEEGNIGGGFSLKSAQLRNITDCFRYYYKESKKSKQGAAPNDEQTSFDDPRLEIRCNSDVCFSPNPDVIGGWCARFNGGVDLVSYRKGVKAEQTLCETLYLLLQDPNVEQLAESSDEIKERLLRKKITGSLSKLVPTTIRAIKKISKGASNEGSQVEVRLEKPKITLKTDEIVYDLQEKLLNLTSAETRRVQIFTPEELDSTGELKKLDFSAETVQVRLSEQNELDTVFAGKNGVLKTELENPKGEKHNLGVTWKEGLRIVPERQTPNVLRLTSTGGVAFDIDSVGSFTAKEVDFWSKIDLKDDPQQTKNDLAVQSVSFVERSTNEDDQFSQSDDKSKSLAIKNLKGITPISAEFRGGVVFNAPRGQANISDKVVLRFASEFPNQEKASETNLAKEPNDSRSFFSDSSLTGDKDDSRFDIQCAQMSLWCVFDGANQKDVDLYRLQLQGGVSLVERTLNDASEKMRISAEVAKIDRPSSPNASVHLAGQTGAPALFQTKELELMGADVLVDRATNSFQVLGSGKLDFIPPQEALDAQQKNEELSGFFTNDPIEIRWSNSMILQNNVLCFKANPQDRVVVAQKTQRLECPELRLTLKGDVSLFDGGSFQQKKFDFERLDCVGSYEAPVEFNAHTNNEKGNFKDGEIQEAWYYAKFNNLSFLSAEDKIVSNSGGEFRAVMRAKNGFKTVEQFETTEEESDRNKPQLNWALVHAKFQGELRGSLKLHEATASDGVRLVVGQTDVPNVNIDVDNSSTFPEKFALITGNEASVKINASNVATSQTENVSKAVEIETRDSVVFKSSNVVGRCDTLRYSSQKNAVVMTGSNARNAELYSQEGAGSPKELLARFSRASYRLDTEDFDVESLSLNGDR